MECRICYDDTNQETLISPCLCRGTRKWVHRKCLDKWRLTSNNPQAKYKCLDCKFNYIFNKNFFYDKFENILKLISNNNFNFLLLYQMFIIFTIWFISFIYTDIFLQTNFIISYIFCSLFGFILSIISFILIKNKTHYYFCLSFDFKDIILLSTLLFLSFLSTIKLSIILISICIQIIIKIHVSTIYKIYIIYNNYIKHINDNEIIKYIN